MNTLNNPPLYRGAYSLTFGIIPFSMWGDGAAEFMYEMMDLRTGLTNMVLSYSRCNCIVNC